MKNVMLLRARTPEAEAAQLVEFVRDHQKENVKVILIVLLP